jgi:hypothetical protein
MAKVIEYSYSLSEQYKSKDPIKHFAIRLTVKKKNLHEELDIQLEKDKATNQDPLRKASELEAPPAKPRLITDKKYDFI